MKSILRISLPQAALGLGAFAASALSALAAPASQLLYLNGMPTYIHGCSLPWLNGNYDHDLGYNPYHPSWGVGYDSNAMNAYLDQAKAMGLNSVRIFLLENYEGLVLDGSGYVSGLDGTFLANLDNVISLANSKNLYLELTLLDGVMTGLPGGLDARNFVTQSTARQKFLDNAIAPLFNRASVRTGRIMGVDIMNECNLYVDSSGIGWPAMRTFLTAVKDRIKSVGGNGSYQITASVQWIGWVQPRPWDNQGVNGVGLDYYAYHEYNDNPNLPDATTLGLDRPIVLTEYGQVTNSDDAQRLAYDRFLAQARDRGWAGALCWCMGVAGSSDKFRLLNANWSWRPAGNSLKYFDAQRYMGPSTYELAPQCSSSRRLDVDGGADANGANVRIWDANAATAQRWDFLEVSSARFELRPRCALGRRLDVSGSANSNGANVQIWQTFGNAAQRWSLIDAGGGYYELKPDCAPDRRLDVSGAANVNGANVQVWDSLHNSAQRWKLLRRP